MEVSMPALFTTGMCLSIFPFVKGISMVIVT